MDYSQSNFDGGAGVDAVPDFSTRGQEFMTAFSVMTAFFGIHNAHDVTPATNTQKNFWDEKFVYQSPLWRGTFDKIADRPIILNETYLSFELQVTNGDGYCLDERVLTPENPDPSPFPDVTKRERLQKWTAFYAPGFLKYFNCLFCNASGMDESRRKFGDIRQQLLLSFTSGDFMEVFGKRWGLILPKECKFNDVYMGTQDAWALDTQAIRDSRAHFDLSSHGSDVEVDGMTRMKLNLKPMHPAFHNSYNRAFYGLKLDIEFEVNDPMYWILRNPLTLKGKDHNLGSGTEHIVIHTTVEGTSTMSSDPYHDVDFNVHGRLTSGLPDGGSATWGFPLESRIGGTTTWPGGTNSHWNGKSLYRMQPRDWPVTYNNNTVSYVVSEVKMMFAHYWQFGITTDHTTISSDKRHLLEALFRGGLTNKIYWTDFYVNDYPCPSLDRATLYELSPKELVRKIIIVFRRKPMKTGSRAYRNHPGIWAAVEKVEVEVRGPGERIFNRKIDWINRADDTIKNEDDYRNCVYNTEIPLATRTPALNFRQLSETQRMVMIPYHDSDNLIQTHLTRYSGNSKINVHVTVRRTASYQDIWTQQFGQMHEDGANSTAATRLSVDEIDMFIVECFQTGIMMSNTNPFGTTTGDAAYTVKLMQYPQPSGGMGSMVQPVGDYVPGLPSFSNSFTDQEGIYN